MPITNTTSPTQLIEQAMNKLAASSDGSNRFSISTADREVTDPEWITSKIIIRDLHAKRIINIGICEKEEANFRYAEIISIASEN
ncbi:MAG: hypothetical protein IJ730_07600 [Alphaproteobacteria bacterium]|nr:hypothetical protein [Alphaproteobacteria bacterium]